jgi:vacuolar-type H+-ATPase subunit E/Vma4
VNLEPLRRALAADTESEEERRRAEVDAECRQMVTEAENAADALRRLARLEGEETAEREASRRLAAANRRAREIRLGAQGRLVEELRRRSSEAVMRLRDEPDYPALLARLTHVARSRLGGDVEIIVDPPGRGGVVGRRGGASVDLTLVALAGRAVAEMGAELERLWA